MTKREADERVVRDVMYGAPGEPYDTETGRTLMVALLEQMGLSALTDEAVARLAAMHQQEEEAVTRRAMRAHGLS